MRKKISILIIIFVISVFSVNAIGRVVLDPSNLAENVLQYSQKVSEISQEIAYWQTQYDRMVRAARGLVSGDFVEIVRSIAQLSGNLSRMKGIKGNFQDAMWAINNDACNLLDVYRIGVGYNIDGLTKAVEDRVQNIKRLNEAGLRDFSYEGDSWEDLVSYGDSIFDIGQIVANYIAKGLRGTSTVASFLDELVTIRRPNDKLKALYDLKEYYESVLGTLEENQVDLQDLTANQQYFLEELINTSSEEETKILHLKTTIEEIEKLIDEKEDVVECYRMLDDSINNYTELAEKESMTEWAYIQTAIDLQRNADAIDRQINHEAIVYDKIESALNIDLPLGVKENKY